MKNKKIVLTTLVLVACLIISILGVIIYIAVDTTPELYEPTDKVDFFSDWQTYIKDEAKLNKIVMPGSHDAGSNNMMPLARTQGHDIYDQLTCGVRYFDLRVDWQRDKLVIFHGPIKGMSLEKVLNDFKRFFTEHPTEFVVLDFQHIGYSVNEATLRMIKETLGFESAMKKSVFPSFEDTTIGKVRQNKFNYAIVWTDETECNEADYLYYRIEHLFSFYDSKYHKEKDTNVLIEHFDNYYTRYIGKGFFVLQSQKTAQLLTDKPSVMNIKSKDLFNDFVKDLPNNEIMLDKTNIIMRDFIASDLNTVRYILALNLSKNLVKPTMISEFNANVTVK